MVPRITFLRSLRRIEVFFYLFLGVNMSNKKNQLKKLRKEMDYNSITLKKFLVLYCGITSDSLGEKKISHEEKVVH